jgi:hypothetical protein
MRFCISAALNFFRVVRLCDFMVGRIARAMPFRSLAKKGAWPRTDQEQRRRVAV